MSCKFTIFTILLVTLVTLALPAKAQSDGDEQSASVGPVDQLYACRSIAEDAQRLACFDREASELRAAQENQDFQIINRSELREARRGLFGFSFPKIGIFGNDDDEEKQRGSERITELEAPLVAFGTISGGKVIFTIEGGARWVQTDGVPVLGSPEAGEIVKIEQAALGSYKASIGGRRAIRVRRVE